MKKIVSCIALAMIVAVSALAEGTNQASSTFIEVDIPVFSEFNCRGRMFQDETVIQPNVTAIKDTTSGTWIMNIWGNMAPDSYEDQGSDTFNEIDWTIAYANECNILSYEVGLIEYIYSGDDIVNTHEAYVSTKLDTLLSPSAAVYYDFKEGKGCYIFCGVSHTVNINDTLSILANTGLGYGTSGYNDLYFGKEDDALNDWTTGLTLSAALTDNIVLSTGIQYTELIDDDIADEAVAIYGDDDSVITKIALTVNM